MRKIKNMPSKEEEINKKIVKRKFFIRIAIGIMLWLLFIYSSTIVNAGSLKLTDNANNYNINNGKVVWIDSANNVFLYDISTRKTALISNVNDCCNQYPQINNGKVVWFDAGHHIYIYDILTGVITDVISPVNVVQGQINNGKFVWYGLDGHDDEIYLYDISTGTITQITNNDYFDRIPQMSNGKIVWERFPPDQTGNSEIILYDISTGTTTQITNNDQDNYFPVIDNGKVVWKSAEHNIFPYTYALNLYDIKTGTITKIADGDYPDYLISEGNVIYERNRVVFIYDLSTGKTTHITDNGWYGNIDNGKLVWSGSDGHDDEIYLYDISTGANSEITNNDYDDQNPLTNNGYIIWRSGNNLFIWNEIWDTDSPITDISLSGTEGNPNFYRSDVTATLRSTDAQSGVANTYYSEDTNWNTYTAPFIISKEGTTTIRYYSEDKAGNVEQTKETTINIDKTPPDINIGNIVDNSYYNVGVTPNIVISDTNLDSKSIKLDGIDYTESTISKEGSYTLAVSAADKAGNSVSRSVTFVIDNTLPVITIGGVVNGGIYNTANPVSPIIDISDTNLDVQSIKIALDGIQYTSGTPISTEGSHTLVASAKDKAGNSASQTLSFAIDKNYTPTGSNIKVTPDPSVSVAFGEVNGAGETAVTTSTTNPGKIDGYKFNGNYFDISTTATYSGLITVCLKYDDTGMSSGVEKNLRLEHWLVDSQGHGSYVDITIPGDINHPNPDTDNNIICGSTYTLSPFGIAWDIIPKVSSINAPIDPVAINTPISVSTSFNDPTAMDTHSAVWDWGDDTTSEGTINDNIVSGTVAGSHIYTQPGVYTITSTVTNKDGGKGTSTYQYVVVYDPKGGFVTGGGWIDSPAGAYTANSSLTGKANFGFVSKYQKGATTIPTGSTEFQFKVANLNFQSNTYEWLVIAGARTQYKGNGTINGTGDYEFMLTAIDGQISGGGGTDKFRIKIKDKNNAGAIVYDNQLGVADDTPLTTVIQGGSIVIHS